MPEPATLTEPDLEQWGREVGRTVAEWSEGLVVALRGPLGAGKSVLARAIARGAGVESPMPSPTYNLLFSYSGRGGLEVSHLDLYRLEHPDDVWELGWQELGEGRGLVLIEWPERAESLLPDDRWEVGLAFEEDGESDRRVVTVGRLGGVPEAPPLPGSDA